MKLKIAINTCYGGFGLSPKALIHLIKQKSKLIKEYTIEEYGSALSNDDLQFVSDDFYVDWIGTIFNKEENKVYTLESQYDFGDEMLFRSHPDLIEVIELYGDESFGKFANLKIIEIDEIGITLDKFEICEYDGAEHIREKGRVWK